MKLADLQVKKKEYMDLIKKDGKTLLKEAFVDFLKENSLVKAIKFQAFTPYFNDGDSCVYTIHDFRIQLDNNNEGGDYDDGFYSSYELSRNDKYLSKELEKYSFDLREKLSNNLNIFYREVADKDLFEIVFGDHVQVTVNQTEFEIEEYEHD